MTDIQAELRRLVEEAEAHIWNRLEEDDDRLIAKLIAVARVLAESKFLNSKQSVKVAELHGDLSRALGVEEVSAPTSDKNDYDESQTKGQHDRP